MKRHIRTYEYISVFTAIFCLISLFAFPQDTKEAVKTALEICAKSVIPSVFPFMVCSKWIINAYIGSEKRIFPSSPIFFGFSRNGLILFAIGVLSGFPNGAVIAGTMFRAGMISKEEAEKVSKYSGIVSPSFCVIWFGGSVMKSHVCGLIVFASLISSNILLMIVENVFVENVFYEKKYKKYSFTPQNNNKITVSSFTEIISESSSAMLDICAYITFFSCFGRIVAKIVTSVFPFAVTAETVCFLRGIAEVSCGIAYVRNLNFGQRMLWGSLIMGFGGISSLMQFFSVCKKYGLNAKGFVTAKIVCAFVSPIITVLFIALTPNRILSNAKYLFPFLIVFAVVLFAFLILFSIYCKKNIEKAK